MPRCSLATASRSHPWLSSRARHTPRSSSPVSPWNHTVRKQIEQYYEGPHNFTFFNDVERKTSYRPAAAEAFPSVLHQDLQGCPSFHHLRYRCSPLRSSSFTKCSGISQPWLLCAHHTNISQPWDLCYRHLYKQMHMFFQMKSLRCQMKSFKGNISH